PPFVALVLAIALVWAATIDGQAAEKKYGPGVSGTEIKIGQTIAYGGPASSLGIVGPRISSYYRMINERGGVEGRKIVFISADDGYSPPKTVEHTRRLVEQEEVLAIFAGAALSQRPQGAAAFLFTGASRFCDP